MKNCIILLLFCLLQIGLKSQPSFPGAMGFGSVASGGRGGKVIYVTNLNPSGPGSLQDALNQTGSRYILFKVSGVIPATLTIPAGNGNFTIAGQTSPNGIIVRGFEMYNDENQSVSNVIIRHLRSRIGDRNLFPSSNWIAEDGITIGGVHRAIFDHCSFAHATDEAVDISRSSQISIQNCILAETLGSHADLGGMLINYSTEQSRLDSLSIHYNVWNRIGGRMPEISCETAYCNGKTINLELSNNLFWDPRIELWYEGNTGFGGNYFVRMNAVNNLFYARPQYSNGMYHFDLLNFSQNQLYFSGNKLNLYPQYSDYQLFYCCNDFNSGHPNTNFGLAQRLSTRLNFPSIQNISSELLPVYIFQNAGAFPRDPMDTRLMNYIQNGEIPNIDISVPGANDAFSIVAELSGPLDTDSDGMPDYWENIHGLNQSIQDHNQTNLSEKISGITGYTNLECYLNCLSDALVNGFSNSSCQINTGTSSLTDQNVSIQKFIITPNPTTENITILNSENAAGIDKIKVSVFDYSGKYLQSLEVMAGQSISMKHLSEGIYILQILSLSGSHHPESHKIVISK
ncbi:MAG: T9SS type A sorting domain-containing protein [Saprospiraceae bacterium]|nr:T9SS type A sorting domain-containing protein [Saprospiraceae bacterium]